MRPGAANEGEAGMSTPVKVTVDEATEVALSGLALGDPSVLGAR